MPHRIITPASPSKLSSLPVIWKSSDLPSLPQPLLTARGAAAWRHGGHVSSMHHSFGCAHQDSRLGRLMLCAEWSRRCIIPELPLSSLRRVA
jgi:hypothetical protein